MTNPSHQLRRLLLALIASDPEHKMTVARAAEVIRRSLNATPIRCPWCGVEWLERRRDYPGGEYGSCRACGYEESV